MTAPELPAPHDLAASLTRAADPREALDNLRHEVGKAVVGQDPAVTGLVIALLCRGHVLLEGVPGVAKTLLVRAVAASLDLGMKRVQFTPDLMPGDITGSLVYDRSSAFTFREGPVFTNLLLADEINRTPPKTQASLLEAMEERQVSVDGTARLLPDPFVVCATQNPVEYEGTYPLPEAQLDRFLLKIRVSYPSRQSELGMLDNYSRGFDAERASDVRPPAVLDEAQCRELRSAVDGVKVAPEIREYIADIVRATRGDPSLTLGGSPRASVALFRTARAAALLGGRDFATPDDVKQFAHPVLRHRVMLSPEAEVEGRSSDDVLDALLTRIVAPK